MANSGFKIYHKFEIQVLLTRTQGQLWYLLKPHRQLPKPRSKLGASNEWVWVGIIGLGI